MVYQGGKMSCKNCKRYLNLIKFDYLPTGKVNHDKMRGYVCTAFASEGDAVWMCGLNPAEQTCEMYEEKTYDE